MSPDAKQILQSILKRDATLTECERTALRSIIARPTFAASQQQPIPPEHGKLGGRLLTRAEVARHLGASISTVERLEKTGYLRPVAITSDSPRFLPDEVQAFIEQKKAMRAQRRPGATA